MEERDIAIKIEGLRKRYRLGTIGGGTLRGDFESWWACKRGKEDPNSKIGAKQYTKNEIFYALDGIDLTIYKGERIGIIGHNGAGKSTLLKLLARVTAPTEGRICLDGRIASMLEVGMGFNGELTGRENIYLNGAILGMTKAEVDAKIEQIIDFSEVRQFIDTPVKRYSSGMYVKLAFAVAAHLDSEIMIMDEVLAVGDVNFQQKCLKKMRSVAQDEGRTVLYVSHNMSTVRTLCDRCIVLEKGKIIFEGDVDQAIFLYSQNKQFESERFYRYDNVERAKDITGKMVLQSLELDNNEINMGDGIDFQVCFLSYLDFKNAIVRFVLFDQNGSVIGATYSQEFHVKAGDNSVNLAFDSSMLSPGNYYADIIMCSFDGQVQEKHDIITRAFFFSVNESKQYYSMTWNKYGWGNIVFSRIKVK